MRIWIKKTLKWMAMAGMLLLLVVGGIFALFQTTFGKNLVIHWIGATVSGSGGGVTLREVQGVFPFDMRIDHLVLKDKEGDWLIVDGFIFRVSVVQLFRGRLDVREIQARKVRLDRLPQTDEAGKEGGQAISWPARGVPPLPRIRVERVRVDDFFVGAPILGRDMTFLVDGRLESHAVDRSIKGIFQLKRTDGPAAEADLSWTVWGEPARLSLDLTASEEAGGVVASALDLADGGPVRLSLKGTSLLADWTGDLRASVGNLGSLICRVGWVLVDGLRVRADGIIRPHESYLTRTPWNLLGKEARFGAEVALESGEPLTVRRGSVTGENASLEISGRLEDGSGAVSSDFHFTLANLDVLAGLGMDLAGSLRGEGKVTGTLERPKITLDLEAARGISAGDFSATQMAWHLEGEVRGKAPDDSKTWGLKGDGRIQGLHVPVGPQLPDGGAVILSFEAAGQPDGMIEVKGFHLSNRDLKVGLTGEVSLRDGSIPSFRGKMVCDIHDLSRYSTLLGVDFGGRTGFSADLDVNGGGSLVTAGITGKAQGFTSASPIVNVLAEKEVRYRGVLTITEEGSRIAIAGLEIDSGRVRFQGEGRADLEGGQTNGRIQVAIPDLAFLSEPTGTHIDGSLTGIIQIQGALSAPTLAANITMAPIELSELAFGKVTANVQAENLLGPDWSGTLAVEAVHDGRTLKLESRYSANQERLSLASLSLNGPGIEVGGHVRFDFDSSVLEGDMSGTVEGTGLLSDVLEQEVEGKANVEVSAKGGPRGQELRFNVSAPEVVTTHGKAGGLAGSGQLYDVFGHVTGDTEIHLKSFEREGVNAKGVVLRAKGDPETVDFEGAAQGELGREPFDLKTGGKLALRDQDPLLQLSHFKGKMAGHEVALKGPTSVRFKDQGFILEKTEIRLDTSNLSAEGSAGLDGVTLDGRFEGIPLEMIRVIGFPELLGSASGKVRITGRIEAPTAEAHLEIKGLRPVDKTFAHLPEAAVTGSAQVKDRTLSSKVEVTGISEKPIVASFEAPVVFALSPLVFSLGEGGAMEGRLDAEVKLETLLSYFPTEDHRATGALRTTLSLSGKPVSPNLTGTLDLEGGSYDNLNLGLLLRDVVLQLAMKDDQVKITTFRATDGEKGRLDVKGQATLAGGQQPIHFELKGQLDTFKALRQDELTVTATGPMDVKGSMEAIDVSGDLVLEPVELLIPDQFPPEVVPLDVIEVHGSKSLEAAQEPKPEPSTSLPVTLDLKLNMPERLFLRGRGLDSEWEGKLGIKGQARKPIVTGNLSVVRGTANVLGKVFKLTSGSVAFDGASPPSPQMEIVAEMKSADITASIRASGSPTDFRLNLESDPPLPSDEILSRVLFGKSTTEITPFQALSLAQSVSELSGRKSLGVFDRTRKMLGLDQLGVTQSDSAEGGTAVSVGKYVSDNVYLQAEKTVTGEGGKVGVAVDVTRNIKLDTQAGADAAQVGVIWQWDY